MTATDGCPKRGETTDSEVSALSLPADIPTPTEAVGEDGADGHVVWHRKHLRVEDHRALSEATGDGDVVCPLFVFDPAFYGEEGLACDARIRFLHQAVTSLDRLYEAAPSHLITASATAAQDRLPETRLSSHLPDGHEDDALIPPAESGLTLGYGDPVEVLARFVDRGWSVLTMATPTSRYGQRRDERVREACGDAIEFVSGDGLVRDCEWTRKNWQSRIEEWLTNTQHTPAWDDETARLVIDTGVTPARVDLAFDITPTKTQVPTGTHREASTQLRSFVDRITSYPGNISAPQDARGGTSGLSPYLNFGLLSIRQVYQSVTDNAPDGRGREMFISRLFWNLHYNQKLTDWPGWTDRAVNPVFERRYEDNHDPDLVTAWKEGRTGFPMVDASMRCLRETGWLNFRMRAMCASFFSHILQQPWWIGADWYHHHLIDSDVGINYTQWQSQAGLIGKPSQRVYNPRKQVRDHDPDGEWITRWVPELDGLPSQFLDQPERTPLALQDECGVRIGETYPRPVVEFEAKRESFWSQFERHRPKAARQLARPEIAKRASFSGGYGAAQAIADKYGTATGDEGATQLSLSDVGNKGDAAPSSDDREAVPSDSRDGDSAEASTDGNGKPGQTSIERFD